jgi:hypothetical protein
LAEALGDELSSAFDSFFTENTMTAFDVQNALRSYLKAELAALRELHLSTPYGARLHGQQRDARPDAHQRDLQSVDAYIGVLKEALAKRASFQREEQAAAIIGEREASLTDRVELALGLIRADMQVMQQSKAWLTDGIVTEIGAETAVFPAPEPVASAERTLQACCRGKAPAAAARTFHRG